MEYYREDCIGSKYSLKEPLHLTENEKISICDWTDTGGRERHGVFEQSYVRSLQLKYCLGIGLSDNRDCIRCIITLDRTRDVPYSEKEVSLMKKLRPLLDNYFINLFTGHNIDLNQQDFIISQYDFTERENEIAKLMLEGVSPKAIAERLFISVTTVYKHIANMYRKMDVSNRQEFMARLNPY